MDETATSSEMRMLQEVLDQDLDGILDQLGRNPESMVSVNVFFTMFLPSIRFNTLVDLDEVGSLWETVREDTDCTDLVLDYTTSLMFRVGTETLEGWTGLVSQLSKALGVFNLDNVEGPYSVIHVGEETERFVRPDEMVKLLHGNPWLVGLYFLRHSAYCKRLMRESAIRAAQDWNQSRDTRTEAEA